MNCPKCGKPNPEGASACGACGAPLSSSLSAAPGDRGQPISNYLIPAIFATACCCLPLGIVSIVYAAQVNGKLAGGDVAGARQSAGNAKMWFWIAFGLGLAFAVLQFIAVVIFVLAAMQQQPPGQFRP